MTARAMHRYEVPIDGKAHVIPLSGEPVAVAIQARAFVVEFWAENIDDAAQVNRIFQVFGTGHPLPDGAKWVGTCPRADGLVWHLYFIWHLYDVAEAAAP